MADLLDFRHVLFEGLLHPIEALKAYIPHLDVFGLLGGKNFSPERDMPDLAGKVILVTGNAGLGLESVRQLAAHNPKCIYLAARTPSKGEAAVTEIKNAFPSVNIVYLPLDISSLDSISNAVRSLIRQSDRLDILMNNAGVMALPPGKTEDGYEIHFGTNYIGHAYLTKLLMPSLRATAETPGSDVRIINLTSEAYVFARSGDILLNSSKLERERPWSCYGYSKLANILFTKELAKRYPTVTSVAVHPGIIKSNLWIPNQRDGGFILRWTDAAMLFFMGQSVEMGARNQLWAATCKQSEIVSGGYYRPVGNLSMGLSLAQDETLARHLWDSTDSQLQLTTYKKGLTLEAKTLRRQA